MENSYCPARRNIGSIVSLNKSNLIVLELTILRKGPSSRRSMVVYTKSSFLVANRLCSIILLSNSYRKSIFALIC